MSSSKEQQQSCNSEEVRRIYSDDPMCKEPPRIISLDKVRHKQPGDREKDSDAHKSEPKVESCRPTRLTELAAAIE
jgi:hypothetical protein